MTEFAPVWALGLMSGTSMDGIDAALIETDGHRVTRFGPASTTPYTPGLQDDIRAALGNPTPAPDLARRLTAAHEDAVRALLPQHVDPQHPVSVIGLHGHTIHHAPEDRVTVQIGDGDQLARSVGINVVCDFRSNDVSSGGQGAPFAPLFHQALSYDLKTPLAVVNIGGISNITWIGGPDADPIAFDTGPGNGLLDDWIRRQSDMPYDVDGKISAAGTADGTVLEELLDDPYFSAPPPKSLDRLDLGAKAVSALSPADGATTLVHFTCRTVLAGLDHLPAPPKRLLITGGGRRNPTIMKVLAEMSGLPVDPVEAVGWDGDALEAQAFAFLAVRSVRHLPLSVPTTTGVPKPTTGGHLHNAP